MIARLETNRARWIICFVLATVTLVLYWRVRSFEFLCYDDPDYVTLNYHVQSGLNWAGLGWAFTSVHSSNWHPLTWLSHMLDFNLWRDNSGGHHFTNILFHSANVVLVFLVLQRLTGATWKSTLVAAFFGWHPLHVESVAWVSERKDVLSTFFWLLTMGAYALYAKGKGLKTLNTEHQTSEKQQAPKPKFEIRNPNPKACYSLALVFFTLGLMSKPMIVTLPCVLLLLDYWPLHRISEFGFRNSDLETWRRLVFEKLPFFGLSFVSAWITIHAQTETMSSLDQLPMDLRLVNALVSYFEYLTKMFWPSHLAVFYPLFGETPVGKAVLAFLVLSLITYISFWQARRFPYVIVGWLWFLGTLIPVIGIIQVGQQAMADRYTYLPLLGLFIALIWGLAEFSREFPRLQWGMNGMAVATLTACCILTSMQLRFWRNDKLLFTHARDVTSRNTVACAILASKLETSDPAAAIEEYDLVLSWKPNSREAMFGKGRALQKAGRSEEAMACFRNALQMDPNYPELHNSLGALLAQQNKFAEAEAEYRAALKADPEFIEAHLNLGLTLMKQRKVDQAVVEFQQVLAATPDASEALVGLGSALAVTGKPEQAIARYAEALRLQPHSAEAHRSMGAVLVLLGKTDEAVSHFEQALSAEPNDPSAHFQLGSILSRQHRTAEAIQHYEAVLRAQPDFVEVLNNLAWIKATSANPELRDGLGAVRLAQHACDITHESQPFLLGTLAAAFAEAGRFSEAVSTARKAVELASAAGLKEVAARNEELLAVYGSNRAYHE